MGQTIFRKEFNKFFHDRGGAQRNLTDQKRRNKLQAYLEVNPTEFETLGAALKLALEQENGFGKEQIDELLLKLQTEPLAPTLWWMVPKVSTERGPVNINTKGYTITKEKEKFILHEWKADARRSNRTSRTRTAIIKEGTKYDITDIYDGETLKYKGGKDRENATVLPLPISGWALQDEHFEDGYYLYKNRNDANVRWKHLVKGKTIPTEKANSVEQTTFREKREEMTIQGLLAWLPTDDADYYEAMYINDNVPGEIFHIREGDALWAEVHNTELEDEDAALV